MYCSKCGTQISDDSKFCPNCGERIESKFVSGKSINSNLSSNKKVLICGIFGIVIIVAIVFFLFSNKKFKIEELETCKLVTDYGIDVKIDDMETIEFGNYPQISADANDKQPIEWIVLDRRDGKALLLSKYILDCKCYNDTHTNITWENCSLRTWLNNTFINEAFTASEQGRIINSYLVNNDNSEYGTNGGSKTYDKIFCLSIDEVKNIFINII